MFNRFVSKWFFISALALVTAIVGIEIYRNPHPAPPPCSWYSDYPMKDVPARCIKEFQK